MPICNDLNYGFNKREIIDSMTEEEEKKKKKKLTCNLVVSYYLPSMLCLHRFKIQMLQLNAVKSIKWFGQDLI